MDTLQRHGRAGGFCRGGCTRLSWAVAAVVGFALVADTATAEVVASSEHAFRVERTIVLPLAPGDAYDVMTRDVSAWWDHSFSEFPKAFYIEPRPGGGFYEIFDDDGNGVLHATVTYAHRGKTLRFVGPLGLAGAAFQMVTTIEYTPHESGTLISLTVNASGQIEKGWDEALDGLWHHFLDERLGPYVESGRHQNSE